MIKNITNSTYTQPQRTISSKQILEDIKEVIKLIEKYKPKILYYAISEMIEKGKIIHINETKINPEYIIVNREDFEKNEELIIKLSNLKPLCHYDWTNYYIEKSKNDLGWYI